jgi:ABC-2 type transport system permease protein
MFESGVSNLFFAMFCLWLFGVFLLALTALAATFTDKGFICMIIVGVIAVILNIINIIPAVGKYNPVSLTGTSMLLLTDNITPGSLYSALAVSGICIVAFTLLAVILFNKKRAVKKIALLAAAAVICIALTVFIG